MSGDPFTMAAGGAAAGALLDKKNPLRGAALGGFGGYMAGPNLAALGGAVPGVTAGSEQAAMLAAQNEGLGAAAGLGTAEAAATAVQPSAVPALSFGKNMAMGAGGGMSPEMMAMNGGRMMMGGQQQQQQMRPMMMGGMAAPPMQASGGSFAQSSPFVRQAFGPGGMPGTGQFGPLAQRRIGIL